MAIPDMNHEGCMYKSHNPRKHWWYSSFQATAVFGRVKSKGGEENAVNKPEKSMVHQTNEQNV